ncbi:MAG TPA: ATP-binding protein [Bacteroidales bacterium]|nr:ATP-binding protein [Bacteroidales bacterium]HPS18269.1 ATP-binding protein [Bacteroidales bacterium]
MLKRQLFHTILPQLEHKNAIIITGMRQVGKTTLMRQLFKEFKGKKLWFDFDNPLDLMTFENINYKAIYADLQSASGVKKDERLLVCIDEIQNFPEITKIIKYLIDYYAVKFIVTGSSNYYLRNLFPESLSGRKFLYVLPVLTYREFLLFNGKSLGNELPDNIEDILKPKSKASIFKMKELYDLYIEYGGFPEVALTPDIATKKMILKNIFASFFEKDIKVFTELKDVRELRDLILLLAARNGNMIDISKFSSELGINRVKLYNYIEFLQGIFFLRLIPKYSKSIDRSIAGGKKIYFSDTGILNIIAKVTEGQILEVAVANQLSNYGNLSFYNKRNTSEIDFILNNEFAFKVKQKAIESDYKKLVKISKELNIEKSFVISKTFTEGSNIVYPFFI